MKGQAGRARLPFLSAPALLMTAGLLLVAMLVGFATARLRNPLYQVWLNGEFIGEGRDFGALESAVAGRWQQERSRTVTLEAVGREWSFRLADLGMGEPGRSIHGAMLEQSGGRTWWERIVDNRVPIRLELSPQWDVTRLQAALLPVAAAVEQEAVPARLEIRNRKPVILPEQNGQKVDIERLLGLLASASVPERLSVPIRELPPPVTTRTLEAMRIRKLVAEWNTRYNPDIPRGDNVARAARAFDGLILSPGQILSYNATVGPVSLATGWKEAPVIEGGVLVPGVGGGVCQVATTLYGAAIRADLEIVERHPHQLQVSYVQPSQDAAIAQGWEDLKLRNNTEGHLLIETEIGGGVVTFRIYGDKPAGREVKIESQVTGTRPFATKLVEDSSLAPGQQVIQVYGAPGTNSEAYKLVYQDGKLLRRELLSRDSYLPVNAVVLVGPVKQQKAPDEESVEP